MTPTKKLLQDVKKRLEKATPGPWHIGHVSQLSDDSESADIGAADGSEVAHVFPRGCQSFIANAPTDLAKLIEIVECLREGLEKYKGIRAVQLTTPDSTLSWYAADEALKRADEIARGRE